MKPRPRRLPLLCLPLALALLLWAGGALAQVRIKDIADVEGVRDNQLVGYGLVVGLNGTGDKLDKAVFTRESLVAMLERLGVNTRDQIGQLKTKNVAAVMVTAEPAAVRARRQPHRHRRLGPRRRHRPDGRHAAGDPADGRRRRGLCGGAGRADHRRDRRARGGGLGDARRADRRAHRQRRHRRARGALFARRAAGGAPGAAQPGPDHGRAHRRGGQPGARRRRRPRARPAHGGARPVRPRRGRDARPHRGPARAARQPRRSWSSTKPAAPS